MLRMPRRAWPLWVAGGTLWFGMAVPLAVAHGHAWFQLIAALLVFSPAAAGIMAVHLVQYRAGGAPVFVFVPRNVVTVLLSVLDLAVSALVLLLCIGASVGSTWPWTMVSLAYAAAWLVYLQLLRAAALHRASAGRDARRLRGLFA